MSLERAEDAAVVLLLYTRPGQDDAIDRAEPMPVEPEALSNYTLDSIPVDRSPYRAPRDRQPQAGKAEAVWASKHDKAASTAADVVRKDSLEIGRPSESGAPVQARPVHPLTPDLRG